MNTKKLFSLALVTFLSISPGVSFGDQAINLDGQTAVAFAKAKRVGKANPEVCGGGREFIDGIGQCWQCPKGYKYSNNIFLLPSDNRVCIKEGKRTNYSPNKMASCFETGGFGPSSKTGHCYKCDKGKKQDWTKDASVKGVCYTKSKDKYDRASKLSGKGVLELCKSGSFYDLADNGSCWKCPKGYDRFVSDIKSDTACVGVITADPNWMSHNPGQISKRLITNVMLPGTHDSGSFSNALSVAVKTQNMPFKGQLELGIRYFDLRVCSGNGSDYKENFYLCHAGYTATNQGLNKQLEAVKTFVKKHPKEIVILDFHKILDNVAGDDNDMDADRAKVDVLFNKVGSILAEHLIPQDVWQDRSIQYLWDHKKNIVVLAGQKYLKEYSGKHKGLLSSKGELDHTWYNSSSRKDTLKKKLGALNKTLASGAPKKKGGGNGFSKTNKKAREKLVRSDAAIWSASIAANATEVNKDMVDLMDDMAIKYPYGVNAFLVDFPKTLSEPASYLATKWNISMNNQFSRHRRPQQSHACLSLDEPHPLYQFEGISRGTLIDAAVHYGTKVYLFTGSEYYRYDSDKGSMDRGYPKALSGWKLPKHFTSIDAATAVEVEEKTSGSGAINSANAKTKKKVYVYFFSGNQYTKYDTETRKVVNGFEKGHPVSRWKGLPKSGNFDSAFSRDNRVYFFKDDRYWRYDMDDRKVDQSFLIWTRWGDISQGPEANFYSEHRMSKPNERYPISYNFRTDKETGIQGISRFNIKNRCRDK